jgi:zinc transport system substrate-binding protein
VNAARGATLPCLTLLLLGMFASACREAPTQAPAPDVVASIPPLAWFVDRLAGGALRVETLLPPGANPHSFEPTLAQLEASARASLWVRIGHPSFPFERASFETLVAARSVFDAADETTRRAEDPHIWLSPRLARGIAARLAPALAAQFPAHAGAIEGHASALDAELAALEAEIAARLAPLRGKPFFVYHPEWSAFAADFGLRQVALERDHKEPDVRALRDLVDEARREAARAIFVSPQFSRESAELVAGEVGAEVIAIDPLAYDLPATLRSMSEALAR